MTEDEAKTKWCPNARSARPGGNNRHSDGNGRFDCLCIGSGCMAWRWQGKTEGYCGNAGATNGHGP